MSRQRIFIPGAGGSLARAVIPVLLAETDAHLTLYLRNAARLAHPASDRVTVSEGDVLDTAHLTAALAGQTLVYANLAGVLEALARSTVAAMDAAGVKRLVWVSSMGIYNETGEKHGAVLDPYRQSAAIVEASGLDYTIIRPGRFTNSPAVDYRLTQKGEAFRGHEVSRRSIADLISKIAQNPALHRRESLGIARV
ncbi:NAD(P)H-binding protein [uncultured Cardiobacterium sp.]|uniref:NAD(P)H-binding protein n=1 Tax=uncultured Cardiobacterium sp. TaxID=417619 RepID=UPI002629F43F|nr:NAD(P)H-binding protein [uncultured Cardiobacterium sp.]